MPLSRTVLLKLNGGLGTSMGLDRAKSLLIVRNNLTFLDIIARQALLVIALDRDTGNGQALRSAEKVRVARPPRDRMADLACVKVNVIRAEPLEGHGQF